MSWQDMYQQDLQEQENMKRLEWPWWKKGLFGFLATVGLLLYPGFYLVLALIEYDLFYR